MKRYVLLEDNSIMDTKGDNNYKIYEDTLWHNSMVQGVIKQQSDNILDLVEELDCVEEKEGFGFIQIQNITKEGFYSSIGVNYMIERKDVGAIWKRSGDIMRRYEV